MVGVGRTGGWRSAPGEYTSGELGGLRGPAGSLVDEGLGGLKHDVLDQPTTPSLAGTVRMLAKPLITYSATGPPVPSFHKKHALSATQPSLWTERRSTAP